MAAPKTCSAWNSNDPNKLVELIRLPPGFNLIYAKRSKRYPKRSNVHRFCMTMNIVNTCSGKPDELITNFYITLPVSCHNFGQQVLRSCRQLVDHEMCEWVTVDGEFVEEPVH